MNSLIWILREATKNEAGKHVKTKEKSNEEGWLRTILALRLIQESAKFANYSEFAEKAGLSRGTLYKLRSGQANPTLETLEVLAKNLGISVWELLAIRDENRKAEIESFGLCYAEIQQNLEAVGKVRKDIRSFTGIPSGSF